MKPRGRRIKVAELPSFVRTGELTVCPWCGAKVVINTQRQAIAHAPENCFAFDQSLGQADSFAEAVARFRAAAARRRSSTEPEKN